MAMMRIASRNQASRVSPTRWKEVSAKAGTTRKMAVTSAETTA